MDTPLEREGFPPEDTDEEDDLTVLPPDVLVVPDTAVRRVVETEPRPTLEEGVAERDDPPRVLPPEPPITEERWVYTLSLPPW